MKKKTRYPIEENKLSDYIKKEYPNLITAKNKEVTIENFTFLNQANFNEKLNCSLTSITACVNYYTNGVNSTQDIYKNTRKIARLFLYTSRLFGTLSFTIGPIYAIALRKYKVYGRQHVGLIKGIGFNKRKIKSAINLGHPIILSMFRDGRGYYKNHTVTVIGYKEIGDKLFLVLNDNWFTGKRYLDYQKLWVLSAVNYY